ncbi:hypothetical protein ACP4OV_030210 [Aristida adscensionis]
MNPLHPEPGLPRRHHHHLVHLHLDPRHHHHVHIRLCHHHHGPHPLAPSPPAHLDHRAHPGHVFVPSAYPAAPPRAAAGEDAGGVADPEPALHAEEAEEEEELEEEPVFVLTDEWAEFFAKSEAKRRQAKQQKNRGKR